MSKESQLINSLKPRAEIKTPIGTDMFLPNTSNLSKIKEYNLTIINPSVVYSTDAQIFIAWARKNISIMSIKVELDSAANQVAGDLKYADDFITQANSVLINDFDTAGGVRLDTSITQENVPYGKAIYLSFDAQPNAAIKQMHVRIEWQ